MPPAVLPVVEAAQRDPAALAVLLFGSHARGEQARDVDLAVVMEPGSSEPPTHADVRYKAFSSGQRHRGLDVSVFQALPLYVRHRILGEAQTLWCRDVDELYEVAFATIREWERFRPHYEWYLEAVARG